VLFAYSPILTETRPAAKPRCCQRERQVAESCLDVMTTAVKTSLCAARDQCGEGPVWRGTSPPLPAAVLECARLPAAPSSAHAALKVERRVADTVE